MFHPESWKKLTIGLYEVNGILVKNGKRGWFCSECMGETFRLGGRSQFPCCHVLFVLRQEAKEEKLLQEIKDRRNKRVRRMV